MNVTCPDCRTVYRIDPLKIPAGGVHARCARCPAEFPVLELVEAGAAYAGVSDFAGPEVAPFGAEAGPEIGIADSFADSFDAIEATDDLAVTGISDEESPDAWGAASDNGSGTESPEGSGSGEPSSESWDAESGSDESLSEDGSTSEAYVSAVESTGDEDGSAETFRAEDASGSDESPSEDGSTPEEYLSTAESIDDEDGSPETVHAEDAGETPEASATENDDDSGAIAASGDAMTAELESDGSEESLEGAESDQGYDRNGFRHDSVAVSLTAEDSPAETEAVHDEEPGSFESSYDDDGGRAETTVPDEHEVEADGDATGYASEASAHHADLADSLDQDDALEPAVSEALDASAGETHAAPAAEAAPIPETLEAMQTPAGFSEVERQIPDADTPLPPAPFGSADPHVRAKRLARALVSDIVVYHPDRRERSIREGTVRQEFREEIRKSWDEYASHVGNQIARDTSYFRDALNELLAGGNELF